MCRGLAIVIIAWLLTLAASEHAAAQCVSPGPRVINATTTNTTSTTHHETDIPVPGGGVVTPGNGPLQTELNPDLAGPNGATVLNALNNFLCVGAGDRFQQSTVWNEYHN